MGYVCVCVLFLYACVLFVHAYLCVCLCACMSVYICTSRLQLCHCRSITSYLHCLLSPSFLLRALNDNVTKNLLMLTLSGPQRKLKAAILCPLVLLPSNVGRSTAADLSLYFSPFISSPSSCPSLDLL